MNEVKYPIITREQSEANLASFIFKKIQDLKGSIAKNILELGGLFIQVKESMLYKYNGCDTFKEYIGQPEIGFKRTSVYNFMKIYGFFVIERKCEPYKLLDVGHSKLTLIIPAIEKEPNKTDEWLWNAEQWSRSDLINAVRKAQGKPSMPIQAKSITPPFSPELSSYKNYNEYIKAHSCILCGKLPVDGAHWPKTEVAGGKFKVPLCRNCHSLLHNLGVITFFETYRNSIDEYLNELMQLFWRK